MTNLPFGSGQWAVWGVLAEERDSNVGLQSIAQDASRNSQPVYLTDDEAEARQLVKEGGFSRDGQFYATTHVVNTAVEAGNAKVAEQTGFHRRSTPVDKPLRKDQQF